MGEAHFLMAVEKDEVVGSITGVLRPVFAAGREVPALYICDLKVAARLRGKGVARRLLQRGLVEILKHPRGRKARLLYGAAMRGGAGDVMRSARGSNPLRLAATVGTLDLFFVGPAELAKLHGRPPTLGEVPSLIVGATEGWVDTAGAKDFRLQSTGKPWRLVHWTRPPWDAGWAPISLAGDQTACFALDTRLDSPRRWLAEQGIRPGARCTVYGLALTRAIGGMQRIHLATSEI